MLSEEYKKVLLYKVYDNATKQGFAKTTSEKVEALERWITIYECMLDHKDSWEMSHIESDVEPEEILSFLRSELVYNKLANDDSEFEDREYTVSHNGMVYLTGTTKAMEFPILKPIVDSKAQEIDYRAILNNWEKLLREGKPIGCLR